MVQFMNMPAVEFPRSSLLDFSPVSSALSGYTKGVNADAKRKQMQAIGQSAATGGYGEASNAAFNAGELDAGLEFKKLGQADAELKKKRFGAMAQMVDMEQDPGRRSQMWGSVLKRLGNPETLSPEEMDPMNGPKLLMAEAGLVNDPLERQKRQAELGMMPLERRFKEAQIAKMQAEAAGGNGLAATDDVKEYRFAKQQGFAGSFMDYLAAKNAPKENMLLDRETAKMDVGRVRDYAEQGTAAEDMLGQLEELKAAREQAWGEGPVLGMLPNLSSSSQRVAAAAENVRLGFVAKTKGSVSDSEMRIFGQATPGTSMSDAAATPIIEGMKLANKRVQERAVFFDQWLRSNRSLDGAQEAWNSFINKHPLIQQGSDGSYVLHPENVDAWRAPKQPAPNPQATGVPDLSSMSTEQLLELRRQGGR